MRLFGCVLVAMLVFGPSTVVEPKRTEPFQLPDHPKFSPRTMNEYNECEYVFAVFGFLSFVLALLDLILVISTSSILSLSALSGRANRSPRDILLMNDTFVSNDCRARSDPHNSAEMLEGTQAAFILLRSFLHSLSTDRAECVHHLMCRGAGEAAQLGPIGGIVSELSRSDAQLWLQRINATLYDGVDEAMRRGGGGEDCQSLYAACPFALLRTIPIYRGSRTFDIDWELENDVELPHDIVENN